ncbi:hypothetical protein C4D60_Mb05t13630 [Musa balbisiana]|uniref:Secreted protein n=1 Tax=Musa balbisiana TaxID=52838 RepID=A0A4S8JVX6_MUSBA|nr:hypothetical protein C4D60_Mb05t13630 [Musa balbisiana]
MARRWTRGHCLALTAVRSLSPAQLSRLFFFCCTWYSLRSTGDIPMASSLQGCDQRLSKEHFLIVTSYAREKRERGHPRKTSMQISLMEGLSYSTKTMSARTLMTEGACMRSVQILKLCTASQFISPTGAGVNIPKCLRY